MIAIGVAAVAAPFVRYLFLAPGRAVYRWLWKTLPDGRLRNLLLKKVSKGDADTWPKLPPGA